MDPLHRKLKEHASILELLDRHPRPWSIDRSSNADFFRDASSKRINLTEILDAFNGDLANDYVQKFIPKF